MTRLVVGTMVLLLGAPGAQAQRASERRVANRAANETTDDSQEQ